MLFNFYFIVFLLISPIIWFMFIFFFVNDYQSYFLNVSIKVYVYIGMCLTFLSCVFIFIYLYMTNSLLSFNWIFFLNWFTFLNINYIFSIDSISLVFILLTSFLFPTCVIVSWHSISYKKKDFFLMLFLTEFFLINFFAVNDLFLLFLFFECILIPMFLIIGVWGSNVRKVYASYQLVFFTLFGSIFLFFSLLLLYSIQGSLDLYILQIYNYTYNFEFRTLIFVFIFISFSIKVPIVPFHFWLPEAHVEAPTSGSIILAGLLLKLGTFGLIKFLLPVYNDIIIYLTPCLWTICCYSVLYVSFVILRQLDLKRIIAYSSIIHMNFILLGLLIYNKACFVGSTFLLLSHGLVSSALFICIGFLYERYHVRILLYYKGLTIIMPIFVCLLFFFILANASLPGTSNFTGELLVFLGLFDYNRLILVFFMLIGVFFGSIINFWVFNKISFGDVNKSLLMHVNDLSKREIFILFVFLILTLWLGYFPDFCFILLKYKLLFIVNL